MSGVARGGRRWETLWSKWISYLCNVFGELSRFSQGCVRAREIQSDAPDTPNTMHCITAVLYFWCWWACSMPHGPDVPYNMSWYLRFCVIFSRLLWPKASTSLGVASAESGACSLKNTRVLSNLIPEWKLSIKCPLINLSIIRQAHLAITYDVHAGT